MKKIVKIFCIIFCFVIMVPSTSVAFAKEKVTPVIYVHGLGGSDIYKNVGKENEVMMPQLGLDVKAMLSNQDILTEVVKMLSKEQKPDYNKLFAALGNYFKEVDFNYLPDGTAKEGQQIKSYWTDSVAKHPEALTMREFTIPVMARHGSDLIGKKNVYVFNYDWRQDMRLTAQQLDSMIQTVKKKTGAKKVAVVALSLGGSVISAYMDAYKQKKDVCRYVIAQATMLGTDIGRLFQLDLKLNKKDVLSYLKQMETTFNGGEKETMFNAITALGDVRIGNLVDHLNQDILSNPQMKERFYKEVLKVWLSNIPALYECIPYAQFDKCMQTMINYGFIEKDSALYKKLYRYHKMQGRFKKNVKWIQKKGGAQVAIICCYGIRSLPVTSKNMNQSDLLIDAKYASGGATFAKYGKKLKKKGKYVSPDKIVDASTGVLPNNTWYIKNVAHGLMYYDTDVSRFVANLACGKVKYTLKAVKKKYGYTQFLKADSKQNLTNIKK